MLRSKHADSISTEEVLEVFVASVSALCFQQQEHAGGLCCDYSLRPPFGGAFMPENDFLARGIM